MNERQGKGQSEGRRTGSAHSGEASLGVPHSVVHRGGSDPVSRGLAHEGKRARTRFDSTLDDGLAGGGFGNGANHEPAGSDFGGESVGYAGPRWHGLILPPDTAQAKAVDALLIGSWVALFVLYPLI